MAGSGYSKNVKTPLLVWLQHYPLDKVIDQAAAAEAIRQPVQRVRRALAQLQRDGQVQRLAIGVYCRAGGQPNLSAELRPRASKQRPTVAAKASVLGIDSEETLAAVLELLIGDDQPLKLAHLPKIEAWRQATRSLILALTEE